MKTISLIDSSNFDKSNNEFRQVLIHILKQNKELYSFLVYSCDNNSINSFDDNKDIYSKNIKINHVKVPKNTKNVFAILHAMFYADLVFVKGINASWLFPLLKIVFRKKIVLLYSHQDFYGSHDRTLFKYIDLLKEYLAIKFSHRVITNLELEQDYLCAKYSIPVDYIENGGSHVERIESTFSDHIQYPFLKYMYATSNYSGGSNSNIESILDAFIHIKYKYLVIIGNWDENEYSLNLKNKYSCYSNIFMLYPIKDKRNSDLILSNSILFIQDSSSVYATDFLVQSMNLMLPVLAFESVNNKFLTEGKASYFKNDIEIKNYLENLSFDRIRKNAYSMFDIASVRFNWGKIVGNYLDVINQVLQSNSKSVIFDSQKDIKNKFDENSKKDFQPYFSISRAFYNLF